MATQKLNLTRDQLATFLKNHEQIKQFEALFTLADAIAPDVVNEVKIEAGTAQATANEALAQLQRIANALELLAAAPVIQNNNSVVTDYIDLPENGPHVTQARRVRRCARLRRRRRSVSRRRARGRRLREPCARRRARARRWPGRRARCRARDRRRRAR